MGESLLLPRISSPLKFPSKTLHPGSLKLPPSCNWFSSQTWISKQWSPSLVTKISQSSKLLKLLSTTVPSANLLSSIAFTQWMDSSIEYRNTERIIVLTFYHLNLKGLLMDDSLLRYKAFFVKKMRDKSRRKDLWVKYKENKEHNKFEY